MRNLTLLLLSAFLILRFGYPAFQEWQLERQVRDRMKNAPPPAVPDNYAGLPIRMQAEKVYPKTTFTYTLTDIDSATLSTTKFVELTQETEAIACRNLSMYRQMPVGMWQAIAKVLKEDNVSLTIVVKDKGNHMMNQYTQILSKCENFNATFVQTSANDYKIKIQ